MDIVQNFNGFDGFDVRFVQHPEGKYAFGIVAADLSTVLEVQRVNDLLSGVKEEWKGTDIIRTPGGSQLMSIIWEPGIYQVLAKSRKPNAHPFQEWLFETVLPTIRATGKYEVSKEIEPDRPHDVLAIIDAIFENVPIKPELVAGIKLNAAKELMPASAHVLEPSRQLLITNTAQAHELLTATDIGKELGLSGQAVNKLLIEKGLQTKNENRKSKKEPAYLPTAKGSEFADLTLATASTNSGTFQQLRWYKSAIAALQ